MEMDLGGEEVDAAMGPREGSFAQAHGRWREGNADGEDGAMSR